MFIDLSLNLPIFGSFVRHIRLIVHSPVHALHGLGGIDVGLSQSHAQYTVLVDACMPCAYSALSTKRLLINNCHNISAMQTFGAVCDGEMHAPAGHYTTGHCTHIVC